MSEQIFEIAIDQDEMAAWICFVADQALPLAQLYQGLAEAGVVFGIDRFLIQDLAQAHRPQHWYLIAQSIMPQDGLAYYFSHDRHRTPKRLPDGRVDFYNLDTIQNVVQNQVLVVKVPPEQREPGTTVTGNILAPSLDDVALPTPGENVVLSKDGQGLLTQINGHPALVDSCLRVDPTYTLDGDVDFATGNVTCIGHLVITGDVKAGFNVKSAQNVTVFGVIDGGEIDAGGSVLLHGNLFGQHKSHVQCGASFRGTYVDAVSIEAQADIVLSSGARRSFLKGCGNIEVKGGEGCIIGGTAQACGWILSHDLGCENEVATGIEILPSVDDDATLQRFLHQIEGLLETDRRWMDQQVPGEVCPEHLVNMKHMVNECQVGISQLETYFTCRKQVHPKRRWPFGTVIATGTVYPGVTICIGEASYLVTQMMSGVVFYEMDRVIHVSSLDEIDMHVPQVE